VSILAIEANGLRKTYRSVWSRRKVQVLDGVSLAVPRRSCLGLLGPPGAGKTTLVKILLSQLHPDSGTVRLLGEREPGRAVLSRIGYLPEHARRVAETLRRILSRDTARPELLLLDGPMDGIDAAGRVEVLHLLRSLHSDGVTILLTSHDLSCLESLCSDLAILNQGRIAASGKMTDLRTAQGCVVHVEQLTDGLQNELAALGHAVGFSEHSCWVASQDRLQLNALIDRLRAAGVSIERVDALTLSMESVYLKAMGRTRSGQ
jgi:ABC-2 type transport system ATP-binding protein